MVLPATAEPEGYHAEKAKGHIKVIPAGGSYGSQYLLLLEKHLDGTATTRRTLPVRFVPFTRGGGAR